MAITYRRTNTTSDLTGGVDFNKAILDPASDTTGQQQISLASSETRNSFAFTDVGEPGAVGVAGDYTIEMEVLTGETNVNLSCAVARVNSSGTQQAISAFSSEIVANAGVHTFNFTNPNLGTWVAGDRLRVTYRYRNTHTHTGRTFEINHGGAGSEVFTPFTADPLAEPDALITDTVISQPTLTQQHIVGVSSLDTEIVIEQLALTQKHFLTANHLESTTVLSSPTVLQTHIVSINSLDVETIILQPSIPVGQIAVPVIDAHVGNWKTNTGGTTNLYETLDETVPSDADFILSPNAPNNEPYVAKIAGVGVPNLHTGHRVQIRGYRAQGADEITITPQWRINYVDEGTPGTLISEGTPIVLTDTRITYELELSEAEAANILDSDYTTGVFIRLVANVIS